MPSFNFVPMRMATVYLEASTILESLQFVKNASLSWWSLKVDKHLKVQRSWLQISLVPRQQVEESQEVILFTVSQQNMYTCIYFNWKTFKNWGLPIFPEGVHSFRQQSSYIIAMWVVRKQNEFLIRFAVATLGHTKLMRTTPRKKVQFPLILSVRRLTNMPTHKWNLFPSCSQGFDNSSNNVLLDFSI
jgi:hypothetical protein